MNNIEAFLLFLVYILPFGGIGNIVFGISEDDKTKVILGTACLIATLLIMGYMLYHSKKENHVLDNRKTMLLIGLFKEVISLCILIMSEFAILWSFHVPFRYIMLILGISFGITTVFFSIFPKT